MLVAERKRPGKSSQVNTLSIVLSRKVDYGVGWRFKFKRTLKFSVAPSPLNTLLENAPVLSEALWNKPVDCVLLGVSGAWCVVVLTPLKDSLSLLSDTLSPCGIVLEIKKGTRVLTHSRNAKH